MWEKQPFSKWIETLIAACFYYSGLVKLAQWWRQRSGQSLVILNYHCAAGGDLRQHLLYLHRHYRLLHLETALEELYLSHKEKKQVSDRRTPLVLTFDDGYYDNYTCAFALARELEIPITIFLIPGYIECGSSFWWLDHLIRIAQVDEATIEGCTYHLDQQAERKALAQAIDARISHAGSPAEREEFLLSVLKVLSLPSFMVPKEEPAVLLTWAQVGEMEESGWVSFGAHTLHHPILADLLTPTEVWCEVGECRKVLEQQLGHPVHTFAYPYGQPEHIGENGPRAVQEAGYDWAVTTISGFNTQQTNPHLLRRLSVDVSEHWLMVAARSSGVWDFFSRLFWMPITFTRSALRAISWFRRALQRRLRIDDGKQTATGMRGRRGKALSERN